MLLAPLRPNDRQKQVATPRAIPAPIEGWDSSTALAVMPATRAVQLKNWFPQPGYVELRKGWQTHASSMGASTSIETLMAYNGPSTSKMFAAGGGAIYDITASGAASSVLSGLSNNRWQWVNFSNAGNTYLVCANGTDAVRHYNGTTWASPSITGVASTDLIHVAAHKRRLWFVEKDSTSAWYLATDAIAGAAAELDLGSYFTEGGYLNAIVPWSIDAGTGPDDYLVFISSKGQLVIYQGTDPSDAAAWSYVGTFKISPPIGRRCALSYGTQPLIITRVGIIQLKMSLSVAESQLDATTISTTIMQAIHVAANSYADNFGWEICSYPAGTRLILNIPTAENSTAKQYVMNSLTGAWCEFDGHNANCWLVFNHQLYFGGNVGRVYRADYTSADGQSTIVAVGQTAYSNTGGGGLKRYTMAQALVYTDSTARVAIGVSTDFVETQSISTPSGVVPSTSVWDTATWDVATWGGAPIYINDWTSTPALGRFASVKFTARTGILAQGWSEGEWGSALWGAYAPEQTVQVNGFVVLAETGGVL